MSRTQPYCNLQDGDELQEPIDEEMWLELALHHIDYDVSTDDNKARDQVTRKSLFQFVWGFSSGPLQNFPL